MALIRMINARLLDFLLIHDQRIIVCPALQVERYSIGKGCVVRHGVGSEYLATLI